MRPWGVREGGNRPGHGGSSTPGEVGLSEDEEFGAGCLATAHEIKASEEDGGGGVLGVASLRLPKKE